MLLAQWAGIVDPTSTVDSYAYYAVNGRVLIYVHTSAIDCHEIVEIVVEGKMDDTKFTPDKVITITPTQHVPTYYLADLVRFATKMLVGSDEIVMDGDAFERAKSWLHPSLFEARHVLKQRHGICNLN
jgi:hypothetical protein